MPGRQLAFAVERAAQEVKAASAVVVMPQVVLTAPGELDRCRHALRDGGGLDNVVGAQAPAKPAAAARDVQRDFLLGQVQRVSHQVLACCRVLRRCPQFHSTVVKPGGAVLRFDAGVRDEGVAVARLHSLAGLGKSRRRVAILAQLHSAGLFGEFLRLCREAIPALLNNCALVPVHLELPACTERRPGRFCNDRYARHQASEFSCAFNDKGVTYPRQGPDGFQVGAENLAAEGRALFEHGIQHAGQAHVDAEQRPASDERQVINAADACAQKFVVTRILQLDGFGARRRQGRGNGREFCVTEASAAGFVLHRRIGGLTLADRNAPALRCRLKQHRACGGPQAQEVVVVVRSRCGATGALAAVGRVQIALHNAHVFPVDVQFFGNHHRQRGLDALANFRLLGYERDHTLV